MTVKEVRRVAELGRRLREAGIRLPRDEQDLVVEDWIKAAEKALRKRTRT